jgi:hypothetical protein
VNSSGPQFCRHKHGYVCVCVCLCVCVRLCVYVCTLACLHVCPCVYFSVCVCTRACVHTSQLAKWPCRANSAFYRSILTPSPLLLPDCRLQHETSNPHCQFTEMPLGGSLQRCPSEGVYRDTPRREFTEMYLGGTLLP